MTRPVSIEAGLREVVRARTGVDLAETPFFDDSGIVRRRRGWRELRLYHDLTMDLGARMDFVEAVEVAFGVKLEGRSFGFLGDTTLGAMADALAKARR